MRRLVLIILVVWMSASVWASDDGGVESVFNHGAGARAMGMGNAFVALSDDASAIYYNPSALPHFQSQQISLLHSILFEETIYDYVSYAYPLNARHGFGIAGMRIGIDDIGRRDQVTDLGRFNASQMQLLLSYGRVIDSRLSTGMSLKLAHQSIDNYSAYGFGLDIAARAKITRNLRAGILLQDLIGARLKLAENRERTPFTFKTGLAYLIKPSSSPLSGAIALDLDKPENRSLKVHAGFEAAHSAGLILRGGYDRDNVTLGLGLRYQELTFDYALKFLDRLSDSHRFSLTFNFGLTRNEKDARQTDADLASGQSFVDRDRRDAYVAEIEKADRFHADNKLDSALVAYYRADAFAVNNAYVHSRIESIKEALAKMAPQPTLVMVDSGLVDLSLDFEKRARELFVEGDLIGAHNMASAAGRYQSGSATLENLDLEIAAAIEKEIWTGLAKAESAYSLGDYIIAYDGYNMVLMYDPDNEQARLGSRRSEIRLDMAQHLSLALEYFNLGKYFSSQRELQSVLDLDPGNRTASEYMTRISEKIKKSTTLEDLQKDNRIWQIYLNGLEAFRGGEYEKAIQFWEIVLEAYPNNKNTIENIEQARLRLKK
ncbi:MAG: PorV/PorQ family protein [FCB group bacterium]|nr:PorV/PorQ family protein [FCB group bacterium]